MCLNTVTDDTISRRAIHQGRLENRYWTKRTSFVFLFLLERVTALSR